VRDRQGFRAFLAIRTAAARTRRAHDKTLRRACRCPSAIARCPGEAALPSSPAGRSRFAEQIVGFRSRFTPAESIRLDMRLPEMDGFQLIEIIRNRERSSGGHLPVIAVTAGARQKDREHCLAAGVDAFLAKPFVAAHFWEAIGQVTSARSRCAARQSTGG
jgi:CheY-like chemotaxis protein